jgi:hypothetical protein
LCAVLSAAEFWGEVLPQLVGEALLGHVSADQL